MALVDPQAASGAGQGQHGALVVPSDSSALSQILTQKFREEQNADVHVETARVYAHCELVRLWGRAFIHWSSLHSSISLYNKCAQVKLMRERTSV